MNFGKLEILFWMPPSAWLINWGYFPNARDPEFRFFNILFIELRYFGAFNKKKVCKRCGQDVPESNMIDMEVKVNKIDWKIAEELAKEDIRLESFVDCNIEDEGIYDFNLPPEPPEKTWRERVREGMARFFFGLSGLALFFHFIAWKDGIFSISKITWWGKLLSNCHDLIFLALIIAWIIWAVFRYLEDNENK